MARSTTPVCDTSAAPRHRNGRKKNPAGLHWSAPVSAVQSSVRTAPAQLFITCSSTLRCYTSHGAPRHLIRGKILTPLGYDVECHVTRGGIASLFSLHRRKRCNKKKTARRKAPACRGSHSISRVSNAADGPGIDSVYWSERIEPSILLNLYPLGIAYAQPNLRVSCRESLQLVNKYTAIWEFTTIKTTYYKLWHN